MKRLLLTLLLILFAPQVEAAKRMPSPECPYTGHASCSDGIDNDHDNTVDEAAPSAAFSSVTDGYAADIKNCQLLTYTTTAGDTESSSGTFVSKTSTNNHDVGQIACAGNFTNGSYYIWVKLRFRGVTQVPQRVLWLNTSAFTSGFQNSRASFVSDVSLTQAPAFGWVSIGDSFDFTTSTNGTAATTLTLNGNAAIFMVANEVLELDCFYVSTSSSATPICPSGAPASGVTFDAVGTADSGSAQTTLTPTITVGSDSNRILIAGIAHRTTTNTISSVSSSVDGALTLLSWHATSPGTNVGCALYYKIAPTAGAHTVTVTFSEAQNAAANLVSYEGVSQTAPFSAVSTAGGNTSPATITMASSTDNIGIVHLCASVDTAETITPNASQTERWEENAGIAGGANRVSALSAKQGDSNVTLSWTITGTAVWNLTGVSLQPPSAAGSAPTMGTPSTVLVGNTTATVRASIDDPSATCQAEYEADGGTSPPYTSATSSIGPTGGFCQHAITGLTASTAYVYRINGTNSTGTTNSSEGTFTTGGPVTALGITQAEINAWDGRRVSGPYRITGDVQTNSPGDWTRINNNASTFRSAGNTSENWSGQTLTTCWQPSGSPALPGRSRGEKIRDTAFRFLLTGDTADRDAVEAGLLAQAATAGTQWVSPRWVASSNCLQGDGFSWEISLWLTKLIYAYDYIRHSISAGNRTTLDAWFTAAATLFNSVTHNTTIVRFPNRDSDDYTTQAYTTCSQAALTHFGGFTHCDFHEAWSNRSANHIRVVGLVGIMTSNTTFKNRALRWVKERIRFNAFADSTDGEFHRTTFPSSSATPGVGWNYVALAMGAMNALADAFARSGDTSLFDYSTSLGDNAGLTPAGGPKSLLSITKKWLDYVDRTVTRYGTTNSKNQTECYIIDTVDCAPFAVASWISDTYVAQPNLYWNDARIKSVYMRQASGSPAYPSNPSSFGGCVYCGDWSTLPGVLFMFGQMEGLVNPYP